MAYRRAFAGPFLGLAVALPVSLLATGRSPGQPAARRGPAAGRFFCADPDCPAMVDSFGTLFAMTATPARAG